MINAAYDKVVDEIKEVAAGRRGWVSLTASARTCGVPKEQLRVVALSLGLEVSNHGRHGMSASKKVNRPEEPAHVTPGEPVKLGRNLPAEIGGPAVPRRTDASQL